MDAGTVCELVFPLGPTLVEAVGRLEAEVKHPALNCVRRALLRHPTVYGRRLARHSVNEALGSEFISKVADLVRPQDLALFADLAEHAKDEARHAMIFGALAKRLCGDNGSEEQDGLPGADEAGDDFDDDVASFMASTHVAEVRNLLVLAEYIDVIDDVADFDDRDAIGTAIRSIHSDELRHVAYTARWVSHFIHDGRLAEDYLVQAFDAFRRRMWWEAGIEADLLASDAEDQEISRSGNDPHGTGIIDGNDTRRLARQALSEIGHEATRRGAAHGMPTSGQAETISSDRRSSDGGGSITCKPAMQWRSFARASRALAVGDQGDGATAWTS